MADNHWRGRKHSEETKEKIRQVALNRPNNWLGKHHSDETKEKLRQIAKNRKVSPRLRRKHSDEAKEKMREAALARPPCSDALKQKRSENMKGPNHWNWKGGISKSKTYLNFRNRQEYNAKKASGSHTFGEWETLKAQYNWTCPSCGRFEPEIKLTEDHIIPLSKGGSNNIENIQPLCLTCNLKKHTKIIYYTPVMG